MIWFIKNSWYFLGCDKGKNRWKARYEYFRYLIPAYRRYRQLQKETQAPLFG